MGWIYRCIKSARTWEREGEGLAGVRDWASFLGADEERETRNIDRWKVIDRERAREGGGGSKRKTALKASISYQR